MKKILFTALAVLGVSLGSLGIAAPGHAGLASSSTSGSTNGGAGDGSGG